MKLEVKRVRLSVVEQMEDDDVVYLNKSQQEGVQNLFYTPIYVNERWPQKGMSEMT